MFTTPFEFGAVILVRFPFTNQTAFKQRPAVVVSNETYNRSRPDLVIMAVTSQVHSVLDLGEARIDDWQGAGLLKPSVIKPVFATIERYLVLKALGSLGEEDRAVLRKSIASLLG